MDNSDNTAGQPSSTSGTPQQPAQPDFKRPDGKSLLIGNGCILIATIFWGLNVTVTKALIPEWMSADAISLVRIIGGCALFWLVSLFIKTDRIEREDWKRIVPGGLAGLFGFIFLFITSLKYGNPIDISIIMTLPPVFVILIGVIFLHRRPGWREYMGIVVSFIGAAIVILDGHGRAHGSDDILGDLLAIASTVCYAFYLVILERPTKKYKPVSLLRWVFLFAAIPALFFLRAFENLPIYHAHKALPWIYIGFILVCPTFLGYFLVQPAIKRIGSELVSIYQYLLPVFATISAVLMLDYRIRGLQIVAMVVIVIGMVFTTLGKRRRVKKYGQDDA